MTTLLTGGTGWIGTALHSHLESPLIISRDRERATETTALPANRIIECDLTRRVIPRGRLPRLDHVINLMGESVAEGRWTPSKKKRLRDSRVAATSNLVHSLLQQSTMPDTVVSASAIGYYGDRGEQTIDESAPPGNDFLAKLSLDWEKQTQPLVDAGVRVCLLRIGIVLGPGGGALSKMVPLFRFCGGGRLGTGRQWMSWIHIDDLVALILFLLKSPNIQGAVNATAPAAVRNSEFTKSLARTLGRPAFLPAPCFALRLALGEFADYLCASQRVVPSAAERHGFEFGYPSLTDALQNIVR